MLWGSEVTGRQGRHITHLSRQATLRHFSGVEEGRGVGAWAPVISTEAVFEAAGAGSLSRRMESMKAVGDKGVSAEDGRPGLASSTRGLRGGLGGSSLTRIRVLLDRGLSSMLLPGDAKGLVGVSSVISEIMGPELATASEV